MLCSQWQGALKASTLDISQLNKDLQVIADNRFILAVQHAFTSSNMLSIQFFVFFVDLPG